METTVFAVAGIAASFLAIFLVVVGWRLSSRFWISVSTSTAPFQIFSFPLGTVYLPVSLLTALAAFPRTGWSNLFRQAKWPRYVVVILAMQFISIAWSSEPALGIRYIGYELPLLFVFMGFAAYAAEQPAQATRWACRIFMLACATSAFVIFFRFSPGLEAAYLSSPLARILISPNVLLDPSTLNVNDPAKAGGLFFVNANPGAAFYGFCAVSAWYLGRITGSRSAGPLAILAWVATLLSGSKAGLMAAVAVPAAIALIVFASSRRLKAAYLITGALLTAVFVAAIPWLLPIVNSQDQAFAAESVATLNTRLVMWNYAAKAFAAHPLLGQGFGGWDAGFCPIAYFSGIDCFPPHNALVILWSQSGIVAAIAGALFAGSVLLSGIRAATQTTGPTSMLGYAIFGGCAWLFGQAMGENFGLFGETHVTPLLGMMLGLLSGIREASGLSEYIRAVDTRSIGHK